MKRVRKVAMVLALLIGAGAGIRKIVAKPPVEVRVVQVERGPVRDVVTSSTAGEVVPELKATVRAEIGGRVTEVRHRRGDRIRRGERVVALDSADLEARLAQARATAQAARAQIGQARVKLIAVERQAERARTLAERGAGTAQLSEDTANSLGEAREALRAQEALELQAAAAVRVASVACAKAQLVAPFDGLLVEVYPDPGDALQPGAPAFEIIEDGRLHVDAAVDEMDTARLSIGQPASLTLDALPGRRFDGRIARLAPAVRRDLKGARTLAIEVEVTDAKVAAERGLRPGMSANVEVVVAEKPSVAFLPTNVIVGRGLRRSVYRILDGKARLIAVQTGLSNWERTEILSGLEVGDAVIASLNAKGLEEGAAAKVERATPAPR